MERLKLQDRHVLVIGGAGYIGAVFIGRLIRAGAKVRALDALIFKNGFSIQNYFDDAGFSFVKGDFGHLATLRRAMDGITDVVLLGSFVGDPLCKKYPDIAARVNRDASKQLVDIIGEHDVKRFVFASTCSNYGIHDANKLADENSDLNPQSLYAETKIEVEQYILENVNSMNFSPSILRFSTAYGVSQRMRFDLTVSHFSSELAMGESLLVYDPDTWRPYCHVRDLSDACILSLVSPAEKVRGEVFNVGDNDQQFTKRMIVDEARKHVSGISVEYVEGDTDPRNYRVSFSKIAERLGFKSRYSVQEYVPRLISAVENGVFAPGPKGKRFGNYEIDTTNLKS